MTALQSRETEHHLADIQDMMTALQSREAEHHLADIHDDSFTK